MITQQDELYTLTQTTHFSVFMINTYTSEQDSRCGTVIKTLKNHCDILTQDTDFLLKNLFLVFYFFMILCVSKKR